jgi:hypothetical protein
MGMRLATIKSRNKEAILVESTDQVWKCQQ